MISLGDSSIETLSRFGSKFSQSTKFLTRWITKILGNPLYGSILYVLLMQSFSGLIQCSISGMWFGKRDLIGLRFLLVLMAPIINPLCWYMLRTLLSLFLMMVNFLSGMASNVQKFNFLDCGIIQQGMTAVKNITIIITGEIRMYRVVPA